MRRSDIRLVPSCGLFVLVLVATTWASAQSTPQIVSLRDQVAALIAKSSIGESLGVSVIDTQSRQTLASHNATTPLNPASNMKLITAATALIELGPELTMRTGLYGRVTGDQITGGLFLKGQGDPTLRGPDLLDLAQQLAHRGIKRIDELVVDGSYFDSERLPPAFDQQPNEDAAFRAAVGAVSVDANAYLLRVRPGAELGAKAVVDLDGAGYFEVDNQITTTEGGPASVIAIQGATRTGKMSLKLRGAVPIGTAEVAYRRRVEHPLIYAGYRMLDALRAFRIQGPVQVRVAQAPPNTALLASHNSAPLSHILDALGKDSDNFVAEMVLKVVAAERRGQPGRSSEGAVVAIDVLKRLGVNVTGLRMVNGSGLFNGNQVSAQQFAQLLAGMYSTAAVRPEYLSQLAVAGVDGTLARRMSELPAPRIVRAKTGTLNDAIALSGYVLGPTAGRAVAFSVLANRVNGKHAEARALTDDIVRLIARSLYPTPTP